MVMHSSRHKGFTLIEVMIVVVVLGILSAIAIPSYQQYIARGHRAEAQAALLRGAQWMERHFAENNSYAANTAGTATTGTSGTFATAAGVARVPTDTGVAQRYAITLAATATTYTLTATRQGSMATDRCGNFTVNQLGVRSAASFATSFGTGATGTAAAVRECWR
jgi:type IV pilus assembly protein PilE